MTLDFAQKMRRCIANKTGIPLTKYGIERKIGRILIEDDDTIDRAFEGTPEATWNIDKAIFLLIFDRRIIYQFDMAVFL